MKRLLIGTLAVLLSFSAMSATLTPIQSLNPAGSASGQAVVSTGPTTAPMWANPSAASLAAQAANTVVANVTGSAASPTAFSMPTCSTSTSALQYTSGTGFTCFASSAPLASPALTGTPTAPTAAAGTSTTQIATTAFSTTAVANQAAKSGQPYFQAYLSANQTITANTLTKIQYNTKNFDSNALYDNTTNYRFTPNVPGKYKVTVVNQFSTITTNAQYGSYIYKNGTSAYASQQLLTPGAAGTWTTTATAVVSMNGTTDYLEGWAFAGVTTVNGGASATYIEAYYIGP